MVAMRQDVDVRVSTATACLLNVLDRRVPEYSETFLDRGEAQTRQLRRVGLAGRPLRPFNSGLDRLAQPRGMLTLR